ncbi:MAG: hypothetical protein HOD10_07205 [Candidatus Marinimicrobia bacterium]|jgi:hypothetical protein|nr:hypothetical protein [Candidatus Neomarinimicrobiota bacterium]MBT3675462.1 hypothetical protein [Candidatus Neomarinimicrobiota bacterium]MBT4067780.1 hypothetical protein [Candidatus Neomarinimicrobiota bacterium]MBT4372564.1 hypothetical protein [Candidatus Neomarinimicrobiota bacterium]MBT4808457.1 hypothetical protein [Candidatus Neomarinimicrobiota bacterium]
MVYRGILRCKNNNSYLETSSGERILEDARIWDGYLKHWENQSICARALPQKDYELREAIIIIWPDVPKSEVPYIEIYFNERLVKYPASTFGHNAINVNGEFFNFSHLINENESMDESEFMYRPALGEFAPSPRTGDFEIMEDGTAYFDKFGRNFMRSIHVIRVEGLDTERLAGIYHNELKLIHETPVYPENPEKYRDFSFFNRNCTTIIRDGLRKYGFNKVSGILPRDFFISTTWEMVNAQKRQDLNIHLYKRPQLKVQEAPYSQLTPPINPMNWVRKFRLSKME